MKKEDYSAPTLMILHLTEDTIRTSTEVWDNATKEWVGGDLEW